MEMEGLEMFRQNSNRDNRYCAHCLRTTTHRIDSVSAVMTWTCIRCGSQKHRITRARNHPALAALASSA